MSDFPTLAAQLLHPDPYWLSTVITVTANRRKMKSLNLLESHLCPVVLRATTPQIKCQEVSEQPLVNCGIDKFQCV